MSISPEEKARRQKQADQADQNLRLEGLVPSPEAVAISQLYIDGKIDADEMVRRTRDLHTKKT